ncbi:MAG: hypothetical protein ACI91B_000932 [Planctomycetota bacterium]
MATRMPSSRMPSMTEQLTALSPRVKAFAGPVILIIGVVAFVLSGGWLLLAIGCFLGAPVTIQGMSQLKEQRTVERELARAREELDLLKLEIEQAADDKRGIERFLMEHGYTSAKARRWIALECGIVLPVNALH